jgi:hypothetical protein
MLASGKYDQDEKLVYRFYTPDLTCDLLCITEKLLSVMPIQAWFVSFSNWQRLITERKGCRQYIHPLRRLERGIILKQC